MPGSASTSFHARHCGLSDNFSFANVSEPMIEAMCEDVAAAQPDAIAIVCTNMRGAIIGAEVERRLGIPVLDSVSFTLWGTLRALDLPMNALGRFGSIFADEDDAAGSKQRASAEA